MSFWDEQGLFDMPVIYWAPATVADNGNETFTTPIEIKVAYTDKEEQFIRKMEGATKEVSTRSVIHTGTKILNDGYILLESMEEVCDLDLSDPRNIPDAFRIMRTGKAKDMDSNQFLYKGYMR